jgi:putative ABC transport system ATP-binding protein
MIELHDVYKTYPRGASKVHAIRGVDLEIDKGDFVTIRGPSGSGKSTLLNLIGLLDEVSSGRILLDGVDTRGLSDAERSRLRNRTIGFVFQRFNLIPELTAWQNVALPGRYAGIQKRAQRTRALELLERVGLADRAAHRPAELSGGEEQRVAIARALFMESPLILADEPTGNLDSQLGHEIMSLFGMIHAGGTTILIVTHDASVSSYTQREIHLQDGRIVTVAVDTGRDEAAAPN